MDSFTLSSCDSNKRNDVKNKIKEMYEAVRAIKSPFVQSQPGLLLHIEPLDIPLDEENNPTGGNLSFFSPMSKEDHDKLPLVENSDKTVWMGSLGDVLDPLQSHGAMDDAREIMSTVQWLSSSAERKGMPENADTLSLLTGWACAFAFSKYVVDPNRFRGALLTNWYALDDVWVRMEDQEKKPHVILCMRHSKVSDEKLLKGDLVAILAALQTRMDVVGLEKQMILPILLFSFMKYRARIIEAYHDGERLVVRQSRVFKFENTESAPFELFERYMACDPVGYTKKFPGSKTVEKQQIADMTKTKTLARDFSVVLKERKNPDRKCKRRKLWEPAAEQSKEQRLEEEESNAQSSSGKGPKNKDLKEQDSKEQDSQDPDEEDPDEEESKEQESKEQDSGKKDKKGKGRANGDSNGENGHCNGKTNGWSKD